MFRTCFGYVMDMFQVCYGHVSGVLWTCFGCVIDMFRMCYGHVSGMLWTCFGRALDFEGFEDLLRILPDLQHRFLHLLLSFWFSTPLLKPFICLLCLFSAYCVTCNSPTSGPCCSRDCEYVSAGQAVICRPQDGCQHESCCRYPFGHLQNSFITLVV